MSELVLEAAQTFVPLLAGGVAEGALAEIARQAGEGGAGAVRRVLAAARKALGDRNPDRDSVAAALRTALREGAMTERDLRHAVTLLNGRDNYGVQVHGNAYIGNEIHVKGDFKG